MVHVGVFRLLETAGEWPSAYSVRPDLRLVSTGATEVLFDDTGLPLFTRYETGRYKTIGGPFYGNNLCYPCSGPVGLRQALLRLVGVRKPKEIGYDDMLCCNQKSFFETMVDDIERFQNDLRSRVTLVFPQEEPLLLIERWANATHPKKAMRVAAFLDWVSAGYPMVNGVRNNLVQCKVKTCEFLASHKPRMVGDLGVTAAMMGGWMMDYFKESMEVGFTTKYLEMFFMPSPSIAALKQAFSRLLYDSSVYVCIYYFSDDVICRINCRDGPLISNADISACDGSHRTPLMHSLEDFMKSCVPAAARPYVRLLFEQLECDFIVAPPGQRSERVKVKTDGVARLFSGSVLTTFMNNYAVNMAGVKLNAMMRDRLENDGFLPTRLEAKGMLAAAFAAVGYILEVDDSPTVDPRRLQFLKHSPAFVDGEVVPYLNLGVLFRGFGTVDGDYQGKKKLGMPERVRQQNAGVVMSRVHAGEHCIAEAFRAAFPVRDGDSVVLSGSVHEVMDQPSLPRVRIPSSELALRYSISEAEVEHVAEVVRQSRQGQLIYIPAVARFLELDYGVPLFPA